MILHSSHFQGQPSLQGHGHVEKPYAKCTVIFFLLLNICRTILAWITVPWVRENNIISVSSICKSIEKRRDSVSTGLSLLILLYRYFSDYSSAMFASWDLQYLFFPQTFLPPKSRGTMHLHVPSLISSVSAEMMGCFQSYVTWIYTIHFIILWESVFKLGREL